MRVLTVNCGSSSLKFDVVDVAEAGAVTAVARGSVERIGGEGGGAVLSFEGRELRESGGAEDHAAAFGLALALLERAGLVRGIEAAGHRVVHGGARFREPVLVDEPVLEAIEAAAGLAPLHNGPSLAALTAARRRLGRLPMVATFDTAFYAALPDVASLYALPRELAERHAIRRFGFHGLAHRYMVERFRTLVPDVPAPRLITLQLGNGCSATASLDGRPLDTSMGFTPLEGLVMGTRSGDLDPALPLFIAEKEGLTPDEVDALLNTRAGLLGLSGRSHDMRDLLEAASAGDAAADLAVRLFAYRVQKYAGAYLAVLGGADAIVFGGGIGERAPRVRQLVCEPFAWAGLALDPAANQAEDNGDRPISTAASRLQAWVVHVDESAVIARDVAACLERR